MKIKQIGKNWELLKQTEIRQWSNPSQWPCTSFVSQVLTTLALAVNNHFQRDVEGERKEIRYTALNNSNIFWKESVQNKGHMPIYHRKFHENQKSISIWTSVLFHEIEKLWNITCCLWKWMSKRRYNRCKQGMVHIDCEQSLFSLLV